MVIDNQATKQTKLKQNLNPKPKACQTHKRDRACESCLEHRGYKDNQEGNRVKYKYGAPLKLIRQLLRLKTPDAKLILIRS